MKIYEKSEERQYLCHINKNGGILQPGCGKICRREQFVEYQTYKQEEGHFKPIYLVPSKNHLPLCGGYPADHQARINDSYYTSVPTGPCPRAINFLEAAMQKNDFSRTFMVPGPSRLILVDEDNFSLVKVENGTPYFYSRKKNEWVRMNKLKI